MGKTLKILVCGKKSIGKTTLLEQLVYNSFNPKQKYFPTIEDIYVACWEKDKGIKEKIRFYDTKGMENSKDNETINQMRHLFPLIDGVVLVFSSNDSDSVQCVEKLKLEIEKSVRERRTRELCHFVLVDNLTLNQTSDPVSNKDLYRSEIQNRLKAQCYEISSLDKRDILCKPFIDLAQLITQISTKGSITIKKPKVFSSSKP
ncbi:unnamed protein product [Brachionus calyciflorus]|uniref:Uncharacterized protein n=1 Tax=Brachionus calyciflorus TaxID=104777 RepID=A0A813MGM6_9BILA|nr:unnamed protein product [Brachionus calyciflorus]